MIRPTYVKKIQICDSFHVTNVKQPKPIDMASRFLKIKEENNKQKNLHILYSTTVTDHLK